MSIIQILFSGKGRIRRSTYWLWIILTIVFNMAVIGGAYLALIGLDGGFQGYLAEMKNIMAGKLDTFSYVYFVLYIFMLWPTICINAKRWHDRNRPGWIAVILVAASIVSLGLTIAVSNAPSVALSAGRTVIQLLVFGLGLWNFVECGCMDGTKGPNKYGPSPKGIAGPESLF